MNVIDDLSTVHLRQETVLTVGTFDGVHLGHQALIRQVVARSREKDCLAALVTFHPHPTAVLAPTRVPPLLTTPGEKVALLEGLGIDLVAILRFDQALADCSARDFVSQLARNLRIRELWVGPGFALGRNREGTVSRLEAWGQELGYEVHLVEPVTLMAQGSDVPGAGAERQSETAETIVSSSRIRALLREGHVGEAARMLGRYASISGEVIRGAGRGRGLGFATANLEVRPERAVPANGVYAVNARLGDVRYPGVANIGVRPSFDNGQRTIETHILDFDDDLYGCDLVVEFVARLRGERRFEQIADLVAQVDQDREAARSILAPAALSTAPASPRPLSGCDHRFEEIEHTADLALRVWGRRLSDLFVGAARGMYQLMVDLDDVPAAQRREVRLEAADRESLLVEWLNELLFLTELEGLLFSDFQIGTLTETALVAQAAGAPVPEQRTQVKAATFHNLSVIEDETGWSTQITLDV